MARKTKKTEIAEVQATEVVDVPQVEEIQAEVQSDILPQVKLQRANRVAIKVVGEGYEADFYRTHKKLLTVASIDTGWTAEEGTNKSAQRESFRQYVTSNAVIWGIEWNPNDMRDEANRRLPKYETDVDLTIDTINLMVPDLVALMLKCPHDLEFGGMDIDNIVPKTCTGKGTLLESLGIVDGKYEKSGNWAWADIPFTATLRFGGEEIYFSDTCQLVSGQLKKPHITQTHFNEEIKKSLVEAGLITEDSTEGADNK